MARIALTFVCLATLALGNDAAAQRRTPGYANRPTISPYVNLFRANNGGLNSYFSYVRPQLEVQQFMQNASREVELNRRLALQDSVQLRDTLQQQTGGLEGLQQRPSSNATAIRRPAGRFMSFGTFYPSNSGVQSRRR